ASWLAVTSPSLSVPTYSLSSAIRRSWIFVPRPSVRISNPVARGSSVPQWPTFFVPSARRAIATTSCDVIPAALSTRRTPLISRELCMDRFQNFFLHLRETPARAQARRKRVAASTELDGNLADIGLRILGAQRAPHEAALQFLEKR